MFYVNLQTVLEFNLSFSSGHLGEGKYKFSSEITIFDEKFKIQSKTIFIFENLRDLKIILVEKKAFRDRKIIFLGDLFEVTWLVFIKPKMSSKIELAQKFVIRMVFIAAYSQ